MMPLPLNRIRWSHIILFLIVLAPFFYFAIGLRYQDIASDAASYVGYATSLASGHGYTFTDAAFTNLREPGYPVFLALIFMLFGIGNYTAVYVIQSVLLGLIGLMVCLIFMRLRYRYSGYVAGFLIGLLPAFGLYTHTVGTELLFAFLLALIFYICARIVTSEEDLGFRHYALLGLVLGFTSLVRVQLILFLPLLVLCYLFFWRGKVYRIFAKTALTGLVFLAVIGSWVAIVHHYKGDYAITEGRQELSYYIRARRAELSYRDLTKYGYLWIRRSLTGGEFVDFLYNNEYHKLGGIDYAGMATSTEAIARIKQESLHTIFSNPGHFLYGSLIEIVKTAYIEHDYSNTINRYVRAGMYLVVYGLFIVGGLLLLKTRKVRGLSPERILAVLSLIFIAYNLIILSPFDSIPRYNTPYLTFYAIIGLIGISAYLKQRREKKGTTAKLFK